MEFEFDQMLMDIRNSLLNRGYDESRFQIEFHPSTQDRQKFDNLMVGDWHLVVNSTGFANVTTEYNNKYVFSIGLLKPIEINRALFLYKTHENSDSYDLVSQKLGSIPKDDIAYNEFTTPETLLNDMIYNEKDYVCWADKFPCAWTSIKVLPENMELILDNIETLKNQFIQYIKVLKIKTMSMNEEPDNTSKDNLDYRALYEKWKSNTHRLCGYLQARARITIPPSIKDYLNRINK